MSGLLDRDPWALAHQPEQLRREVPQTWNAERRAREKARREQRREWLRNGVVAVFLVGGGIALLWALSGQL